MASQSQSSFGESSFTTGPPGYSVSSSRSIPPRNLDPATPQNTPANVSSSFGYYINQPDSFMRPGSTLYSEKEEQEPTDNRYTYNQDIYKPGSANTTLDVSITQSLVSPVVNTFRPISAAKVTEKLEHFLAEQKEGSPSGISSDFSSEVTNITSQIGTEVKTSPELQSIPQPSSESNEKSNKIKSSGELSNSDLSLSDIPLNQNSFDNLSPSENTQDFRKIQNNTLDTQTSNLDPTPEEQLNQAQSLSALPLDNIFLEKTTESTTNLNPESIQEESRSSSKPVGPSLSAFFEPLENKENYPSFHPQQSDISTNFNQVSNIDPYNKQDHPSFNQQSTNTTLAIPQPIWNPNKNLQIPTTDSAHNDQVPQPPQFYNPAQLMGEDYKYQYSGSLYVPTTDSVFNSQTHTFLAQPSKSEESRNVVHNNDYLYAQRPYSMAPTVPESTGSATLSPIQLSASPLSDRTTPDGIPQSLQNLVNY